jgi:hypothetical protein
MNCACNRYKTCKECREAYKASQREEKASCTSSVVIISVTFFAGLVLGIICMVI